MRPLRRHDAASPIRSEQLHARACLAQAVEMRCLLGIAGLAMFTSGCGLILDLGEAPAGRSDEDATVDSSLADTILVDDVAHDTTTTGDVATDGDVAMDGDATADVDAGPPPAAN